MRKHVHTLWLALGLLALAPSAGSADDAPAEDSLAETWVAWQDELSEPIDWAYGFALRSRDVRPIEHERRRLLAEIELVGQTMDIAGRPEVAQALGAWSNTVEAMEAAPEARSAERLDLPWLLANLRHAPAAANIEHIGYCTPPDWVELWSLDGVDRHEWTPGMTLQDLLAKPPRAALRGTDTAAVVSPLGEVHEFGVAPWNRENTAIAPGTRVMAHLHIRDLGGSVEGDLLNQRLPRFLATRLPGDNCTIRKMP
ncbi:MULTISPECIES: capsule biosynthesis GfcC family protein [unclassified Thioalkalivibrio]|uniref:capsule biosynthesis GfcC family protein n=1 Tax=unclassified Thioalkalivibrio TaxID=2621013 RepID=UPI0003730E0C|nr:MULTISPECIES: capsule biosynthesis GfcC family protein [unclassified Thioalkalivibrio]